MEGADGEAIPDPPQTGTKEQAKFAVAGPLLHDVKVHTADKRDGAILPAKRASTPSTSQENTFRCCRRQVSTTVSNRSIGQWNLMEIELRGWQLRPLGQ
jgi:hypothetical protein